MLLFSILRSVCSPLEWLSIGLRSKMVQSWFIHFPTRLYYAWTSQKTAPNHQLVVVFGQERACAASTFQRAFSYPNIRESYDVHIQLISVEWLLSQTTFIYGHSKLVYLFDAFVSSNRFWASIAFTVFGAQSTTSKFSITIFDGGFLWGGHYKQAYYQAKF